jgi:hypothetical protein
MMASADKAAVQRVFTAMMKLVKLDISALERIRQPVTIATRRALAIDPEHRR